jgi:flagellar hook-basal body protein
VVVQNGAVTSITVNEGGIGYAENDVICFAASDVGGSVASICKATVAGLLSPDSTDTESSGVDVVNTNLSSSLFEPGVGYESDGTFYNVPLSTNGSGSGAYATIVIDGGEVSTVTITTAGTGYSIGDSLYISDADAQSAGMDSGTPDTAFSTVVSSLIATGQDKQGSTYTLTLSDGTVLSVKQRSDSASGDYTYVTNADRFAVFAALDGNAVGSDASASSPITISIGGVEVNEQISLGTMAFVNGKNIDSLARDAFNTPQFVSNLTIDASGGEGTGYGETNNGGIVQLTMDSTNMTGYSSTAMTYDNNQDGHATAYIAGYSVDAYGKLVATFDNGTQLVKGRVALAYFNNFEGLIPTGDNLFAASTASGDAETGEYANEGVLGAIRSKALESSNVDLTSELVRLMILQRHYSAVSQATKVQAATIIDDALNIGR